MRVRLADHVAARRFEREFVLLNLETGQYHGLDETGALFLQALEDTEDTEQAVRALAASTGVAADRLGLDLRTFCDDLAERNLIELLAET